MRIPLGSFRTLGFTLIELLVVIAIISLLVSILLPSLQKAKELAKMVACEVKVRNIGIAAAMYIGEHSGDYPYSYSSLPVNYALHPYLSYYDDPSDQSQPGENWTCPSREVPNGPAYGANPGFSRGNATNGFADVWGPIPSAGIPTPQNTIWVTEGGWRGSPGTYVPGTYPNYTLTSDHFTYKSIPFHWESVVWGPAWSRYKPDVVNWAKVSLRHLLTANAVFADGHVESMDYDTLDYDEKWLLPR
ncbi:MAG: type II secretion system protein [Phycisphaerae bacterium]|nr:type II secretion system protein [Phycisphaerae bacterium]